MKSEPEIVWIGDECGEIRCSCGTLILVGIYHFKECSECGRKFKLKQSYKILEEKE